MSMITRLQSIEPQSVCIDKWTRWYRIIPLGKRDKIAPSKRSSEQKYS